ncbi:MAG: right-handed parallel beta-helix repeat-containing protein, partial [Coprobacter sp.]|nr:right-handed parallel beta-helix repeat-containing protein [Coprobacter sp.]
VGVFLYESSNVSLQDIHMHYMHGLGIVSQYSRNITMQSVNCMPRENSGRLIASSADFMHFSGCSGKIGIYDCTFAGAHDDPVNVHGTNLRVVEKLGKNRLKVRFMHGQSYGFHAFSPGDTVAFVRAETMERFSTAVIKKVRRIDDRLIDITLDRTVPGDLLTDSDCIENMTCTPELEIRRCRFSRTNTRGTLVTTPRKVVIADNLYCKTGMSGILIEGDAEGWFESGPVCDVLIENNTFVDCAYGGGPSNAVIALNPSNRKIDEDVPVHRNVRILNNRFVTFGNPVLYAKSTAGLRFEDNEVAVVPAQENIASGKEAVDNYFSHTGLKTMNFPDSAIILVGCKDAVVKNNKIAE